MSPASAVPPAAPSTTVPTVLFVGGTRSGKSSLALRWAEAQSSQRVFVATARALDAETALRVARHREERAGGWATLEEPLHIVDVLRQVSRPGVAVVVDCITMWLANLHDPEQCAPQKGASSFAHALACVQELAAWLPQALGPVALVTAEVGMGIVPPSALGRAFRDLQGEANQMLARACSTVLFASCGLPLALKNSLPEELL